MHWIDALALDAKSAHTLVKEYDFHELDLEACIEDHQKARIDVYKDYMFMVLHFPRYNSKKHTYELNEFNVFLTKELLITLREEATGGIDKIFEQYDGEGESPHKGVHTLSGYILYEIIQKMLEETFSLLERVHKDIKQLEEYVFSTASS